MNHDQALDLGVYFQTSPFETPQPRYVSRLAQQWTCSCTCCCIWPRGLQDWGIGVKPSPVARFGAHARHCPANGDSLCLSWDPGEQSTSWAAIGDLITFATCLKVNFLGFQIFVQYVGRLSSGCPLHEYLDSDLTLHYDAPWSVTPARCDPYSVQCTAMCPEEHVTPYDTTRQAN